MNRLKIEKREQVISALIEGCSVRSTERMTGVHRDTILRLMVRIGNACAVLMDREMRNLSCKRLQVDEIWTYVGKKQGRIRLDDEFWRLGDFYTYVALDSGTKLVPAYHVGKRDLANTRVFISDLASRLEGRIQLSSDMLRSYVDAVDESFGGDVDYGRIVKRYEATPIGLGRYSSPRVVSVGRDVVFGSPPAKLISTSHIERQNLTMRMSMRRFTRLTNAFSRKVENLKAAVALHFAHYNFARIHRTLGVTPAMAAGVDQRLWEVRDLVELAD